MTKTYKFEETRDIFFETQVVFLKSVNISRKKKRVSLSREIISRRKPEMFATYKVKLQQINLLLMYPNKIK